MTSPLSRFILAWTSCALLKLVLLFSHLLTILSSAVWSPSSFPCTLLSFNSSPFITQKNFVPLIRFMVFKMTGLSSWFQRNNQVWKICNGYRDISQNVSKYAGLVWRPRFWYIFVNISGPGTYFSNPIFALKPWAQAGRFEYHEPMTSRPRNNLFLFAMCSYNQMWPKNVRGQFF